MQLVIITGMSGSGKSTAMKVLEDIGFYCIDNLPPQFIPRFVDVCTRTGDSLNKVAIAVDIRTGDMFSEIYEVFKKLREEMPDELRLLFTDASDEVLIRRYKETRRRHPLAEKFPALPDAIQAEREKLLPLKSWSDYAVETSHLSTSQLGEEIRDLFLENKTDSLLVKVMSFGYKYGISTESDLVFDVRCLPNPFYIPDLKQHTGLESCVRDYIMKFAQSQMLQIKINDLLEFLLPLYISEGKSQLVIAFGCTGGKHRSVTFAELTGDTLLAKGYRVHKMHRDITKGIHS
ncbi:MAG: RNase adapter RapZ [Oscillospiraceae bacterium]|nr:RNase adapter RapZ [Oscillospiraceae bacterium]